MATNKSKVWNYFKVDNVEKTKAVCNKCKVKISRDDTSAKTFTTTNMIAHLRSQHAVAYREFEAELASSKSKGSATSTMGSSTSTVLVQPTFVQCASMQEVWPIDHPRAQAISTAIGSMMALDCQPFSVVEDEGFKRLIKLVA